MRRMLLIYCLNVIAENNIFDSMDRNLKKFIPLSLRKQLTPEQADTFTQTLRKYYFNGGPVTEETKKGFVDVSCQFPLSFFLSICVHILMIVQVYMSVAFPAINSLTELHK